MDRPTKRQIADAIEIAETFYPSRQYFGGFSPPEKETELMTKYPEVPGEAEAIAQERADKRTNDQLDELLTPPPSELEQFALETADQVEQSWRRRNGLDATITRTGLRSSRDIEAEGKAAGWPQDLRQEYIRALDREDAVRKAVSTTYRGAA